MSDSGSMVWLVTGALPPSFSGAGRNDSLLAPRLASIGLDVRLVTLNDGNRHNDVLGGIPVLRLGRQGSRLGELRFVVDCVREMSRSRRPPAIVRFRGYSLAYALLSLLVRKRFPAMRIVTQPALYGTDDPHALGAGRLGPFKVRRLLESDAILAMNAKIAESFAVAGYPLSRTHRIMNPVDIDRFRPAGLEERRALRNELRIPQDATVYITSGAINRRKKQSVVTEAFAELLSRVGEGVMLIHLGAREADMVALSREDLRESAREEESTIAELIRSRDLKDSVRLVGHQDEPERFLRAADCFVMASTEEGESNALNEGLACGLCPIVPDVGVYQDQVQWSDSMFVRDRVESLTDIMASLAGSEVLRARGNAARAHIEATRSPEAVARFYAAALEAAMSAPRKLKLEAAEVAFLSERRPGRQRRSQ